MIQSVVQITWDVGEYLDYCINITAIVCLGKLQINQVFLCELDQDPQLGNETPAHGSVGEGRQRCGYRHAVLFLLLHQ